MDTNHKFHLYDNQNELSILLPFPPYSNKVEYGHIQYIIHLPLNFWMSFSVTTSILSSFSSFKDVASSTSSSLKSIKSKPFFKISSFCDALLFRPFFSLDARSLKLFASYSLIHQLRSNACILTKLFCYFHYF